MSSNATKLVWLKDLYPGYFGLTMATGIIAIALKMLEMAILSEVMYVIAVISWLTLLVIYIWRLIRFPKIVWAELTNPSTTFIFFTFVAATNVVGILFDLHELNQLALLCWVFALLGWLSLLHCSFSILTIHRAKRNLNIVHGGWLICIVGTQSLVILGINIVDQVGIYAEYMMVGLYMLWGIGLILYTIFVTLFCYRIFFLNMEDEDYTPLMWVIMGAAAISANAGSTLSLSDPIMPVLIALHSVVDAVSLLAWTWATWWIPLLVVIGYWKRFIRHIPLCYNPMQWNIVFPLGMYAVTSYQLSLAADFEPMSWIAQIMVWVAIIVWALVMFGLIRHVFKHNTTEKYHL
ncbi:MAG: tellurite resistance/C4-dicarboxylate transporter family protein [Piscirickettsiaceae bacterium]|nr:tellurite resistance/C4-dicarboxylate transporter family protein [Piscirickettsiaceae bacterium]